MVGVELAPVKLESATSQLFALQDMTGLYLVWTDRVVETVISYGVAVSSLSVKFLFGQLRDSLRIRVRVISVGSLGTLRHCRSERVKPSTLVSVYGKRYTRGEW